MFKKILTVMLASALAAPVFANAFAAEEVKVACVEEMLPAADASVRMRDGGKEYLVPTYQKADDMYDGTTEKLLIRKQSGIDGAIAYLSFDLSKAENAVTPESLDKVIFTYTIAQKAAQAGTDRMIQGRYTDVYFDINETDFRYAQEKEYLQKLDTELCTNANCTNREDRYHMAGRPGIIWQQNTQSTNMAAGKSYDIDITKYVRSTLESGKDKFTLIIHGNWSGTSIADSGQVMLGSKENTNEAYRPKLTISTTQRPQTVKTVGGAVTGDTMIGTGAELENVYGASEETRAKNTMRSAYFKFNISDMMKYKDYISYAPFVFYAKTDGGQEVTIDAYGRSDATWDESTFSGKDLLGEDALNTSNLINKGFSKLASSMTVKGSGYGRYALDINDYVKKTLDEGKTEFSLVLFSSSNQYHAWIATKENTDTSIRPQLTASVGVTKVLDPEWTIYANTGSAEIVVPDIAPDYELNVFYKKTTDSDYTGMEFFKADDAQNGRFKVDGLEKDCEYEFLIIPVYDDDRCNVFKPQTISTAEDARFAMSAEVKATTGAEATADFVWERGNSAADSVMFILAAYSADNTLLGAKIETEESIPVGAGSKEMRFNIPAGTENVKAFAWQKADMKPIIR